MQRIGFGMVAALAVAATLAHAAVQDPGVKARQATMKSVGAASGILGDMARGKIDFDAAKAETAKADLIAALQEVPETFKEPHSDPESEALPVIWENFDDFLSKQEQAIAAVERMNVADIDGLRGSMGEMGNACGACHKVYKE